MSGAPIFLYTSWRTGGTALAKAFKASENNILFYDPLNQALSDINLAENIYSESWSSNHPNGFRYFEEYLPLFKNGVIPTFPDLSNFKFKNSSPKFKEELFKYISSLVYYAEGKRKTPIFKFEQLEGHVSYLRDKFPSATHIGLVRNPKDQFDSWLEQLALGNESFFSMARAAVEGDSEFFGGSGKLSTISINELFELYYSGLIKLRSDLDATLNLYNDSNVELLRVLSSFKSKEIFTTAFEALKVINQQPTFETKFIRMREQAIELIQQRDELIQQRDELINSTIWKLTNPLRFVINFFKK